MKIINCTNTSELINIESYLYKVTCKWENRRKKLKLDWRVETYKHAIRRETGSDIITQLETDLY
jgi:hypothetical protein